MAELDLSDASTASVGHISDSHVIFGGEEWWFYGRPVRPGDQLFQERRFHDYKVTETKFAGPTMFSRADTVHTNQHGALVARERSTAIRYLYEEATKRGMFEAGSGRSNPGPGPSWRKSTGCAGSGWSPTD